MNHRCPASPALVVPVLLACFSATPAPVPASPAPETPAPAFEPSADDPALAELERLRDEILPEVAELRGLEFKRSVPVEIAKKDGFLDYARERSDRFSDEATRQADTAVARLMGVVPADMDVEEAMMEFMRDQAAGFYEPSNDTFYVVEGFATGGLLEIVLAHELTHALDDQYHDIDGTLAERVKTNTDAATAYMAVVEGSGTSVMNRWALRHVMSGELTMEDLQAADTTAGLEDAPEFLWKQALHSYLQGAAFLARTDSVLKGQMSAAEHADLERAFEEPPLSTEQVLHPEKYWDEEQRDDPVTVSLHVDDLPEGWRLAREDTLGELGLSIFVVPPDERGSFDAGAVATMSFANDASAGWGGDRFVYLASEDAGILRIETVWDTPGDAAEFQAAAERLASFLTERARELGDGEGSFASVREGYRVTLTFVSGADAETAARVLAKVAVEVAG